MKKLIITLSIILSGLIGFSQPCNQTSALTAVPVMPAGGYAPGTPVTFCYTISTWNQTAINWLHGVTPTFGTGWDLTTLTTTPSASLSGSGTWGWYPGGQTGTTSGTYLGAGFLL